MAKYFNGIQGAFYGKVGSHVGRRWKGIDYIAAYKGSISQPNTPAQRRVRTRFGTLSKMSTVFSPAILYGFQKVVKMTPYDRFVQVNWPQVTASGPDSVEINYGMIQVAQGKLASVAFGTVDYGATQHLTISVAMDGTSGGTGADPDDNVYLFAYCPDLNMGVLSAPVKRSATAVTLSLPNQWDGQTVHLYGFARSSSANLAMGPDICSISNYCGTGEVQ